MKRTAEVRRFLKGRSRVLESYEARWQGCFIPHEQSSVRIDRYRARIELIVTVFDEDNQGNWIEAETQQRLMTPDEWEVVEAMLERGFWDQPGLAHAPGVLDGESWTLHGYRGGVYHSVFRATGSLLNGTGTKTFELGHRLTVLAGLRPE